MAKFLNTEKLKYWIKKLIAKSDQELIIIVPYIKISSEMFEALRLADEKGIEITIVYRENKIDQKEKEKILSLKNLNLLHHPNVHCKCYFNGDLIIICSMNLYEYSEKNNREMGVLLHKFDPEDKDVWNSDDDEIFHDTIHEIREILNGSNLEVVNSRNKNSKFVIEIVKTEEEKARELSDELNQYFGNKVFTPNKINQNIWHPTCKNYFDKIDIEFQLNRIAISINIIDEELVKLHDKWMKSYNEYEFKGFKFYWNYHKSQMYLYKNYKFDWEKIDNSPLRYKKYKQGIDLIISKYRRITKK